MSRPADPLLTVFPSNVLRAILCGGEGLPAAYGPLLPADGGVMFALSHLDGTAVALHLSRHALLPTVYPDNWRLPLEHWRARLAMVAAWMLGQPIEEDANYWAGFVPMFAWSTVSGRGLDLWCIVDRALAAHAQPRNGIAVHYAWNLDDGRCVAYHAVRLALDLPSLPSLRRQHDPDVALVLALYDVPEIRARVERTNG